MLACVGTRAQTLPSSPTTTTALFNYRQLIVCTIDGRVHALDPGTGAVRWSLDLPVSDALFSAAASSAPAGDATAAVVPSLVPSVDGALYAYVPPRSAGSDAIGMMQSPLVRRLPVTVPEIVARAPFTGPDGALYLGDRQSLVFAIDSVRGVVRSVLTQQQATVASVAANTGAKAPPGEFRLGRVDYAVRALDPLSAAEIWNITLVRFVELQQRVLAWSSVDGDDIGGVSALRMVAATDGAVTLLGQSDADAVWTTALQAPVIAAYELQSDMRLERIRLAYGAREDGASSVSPADGVQIASHNGQLFAVPSLLETQQQQQQWWAIGTALPRREPQRVLPSDIENADAADDYDNEDNDSRRIERRLSVPVAVALTAVVFGGAAAIVSWITAKRRYLAKGAAAATISSPVPEASSTITATTISPPVPLETASFPLPPLPPVPSLAASASEATTVSQQPSTASEIPKKTPKKKKSKKQQKGKEAGEPVSPPDDTVSQEVPATQTTPPPIAVVTPPASSPSGAERRSVHVGKMEVLTTHVLGRGSVGTVVFEGRLEGRRIAVKRLLKEFYSIAQREVGLLQESDEHPNLVRYYTTEEDADFVYLGLTYCTGTLADWVEQHFASSASFDPSITPVVVRLMLDIAAGVQHIHSLSIVHRDLKPQNILLDLNGHARISDMGLAKKFEGTHFSYSIGNAGSAGWMAPETLALHAQKGGSATTTAASSSTSMTQAMDIFALGCIFFYMVTGQHPFGERIERDSNILSGRADLSPLWTQPELLDLVEAMIQHNPADRPTASEVMTHPFFWDASRKLQFMLAASDRLEVEKPSAKIVVDFEAQVASRARLTGWDKRLDAALLVDLTHHRKYNFDAARDLLRVLRNKANHYYDLPASVRQTLGQLPDGFVDYFLRRYPALLVSTYRYLLSACPHEPIFSAFFPH